MNITYIWLSYFPPQIWKTDILKISEQAWKKGNTINIFVKKRKWELSQEIIWEKHIYRIPSISEYSLFDELMYIFYIPYILKRNNITVDIFHIYNPFFLVGILNILLRILYPKSNIIFDVRTGPLKEWIKKKINYLLITLGHLTATKTIIIHKNLLKNFPIIKKNSLFEVALWFEKSNEIFIKKNTVWKKYIYIGSIYPRRDIATMLDAFLKYIDIYQKDTITILGSWDSEYMAYLEERYTHKNIIFLWSVAHEKVWEYLHNHDYWVAYIPTHSYFMDQPPLKTIEYLWSWLPVIGTKTNGNLIYITKTNGVTTGDSQDEFLQWLMIFREKFTEYDSESIIQSVEQYEWKNIYSYIENNIYTTGD